MNKRSPMEQAGLATSPYPLLNTDRLSSIPRVFKSLDLRRMSESAQSEDWVTWNFFQLLQQQYPGSCWWNQLVSQVQAVNPYAIVPPPDYELVALQFWATVASPVLYERLNRTRMSQSTDPRVVARSRNPMPVEGRSEIDLSFATEGFLVYVEAKLCADISTRTTCDPERNQIVRTIDCLLEAAGERTPYFWMIVRDRGIGRLYTQLIDTYRQSPSALSRDLPHREPMQLEALARTFAMITWRELGRGLLAPNSNDEPITVVVKNELKRRVGWNCSDFNRGGDLNP